jgi:single-stranded-DNA-specific exonuclease
VENLSAYHVGFQIAPRINAPGRMDHATKSFELLISEDQTEAKELALWLNEKNESRQKAMDAAEKEAISKIEKDDLCQNKIIVVSGDWSKGIIGPTASRLVERFGRPVIMFAHKNEEYTGSARSVSGVHILELLEKVSSLIEKFGGHKGAAGLSVLASSFAKFESEIVAIADTFISDNDLIKKLKIDCEVDFPKLSETLYEKIILFEPFGMGNSKPVFMAKNVKFSEIKFVGKDKNHLSFYANQEKRRMKSIFFNCAISSQEISDQNFYDIVFNLNMDEWNNQRYLALNVSDFRISE